MRESSIQWLYAVAATALLALGLTSCTSSAEFTVTGTVVDQSTRTPLEGVAVFSTHVDVFNLEPPIETWKDPVFSAADGSFTAVTTILYDGPGGLPNTAVRVRFEKAGYLGLLADTTVNERTRRALDMGVQELTPAP